MNTTIPIGKQCPICKHVVTDSDYWYGDKCFRCALDNGSVSPVSGKHASAPLTIDLNGQPATVTPTSDNVLILMLCPETFRALHRLTVAIENADASMHLISDCLNDAETRAWEDTDLDKEALKEQIPGTTVGDWQGMDTPVEPEGLGW